MRPARPEADTERIKEAIGDGEEIMSRRASIEGEGRAVKATVGSGSAKIAQKKDRRKDVMVDSSTECQNVLFVPFHTPQAPSVDHNDESTAVSEEVDGKAFVCTFCCVEA